MMKNLMPSAMTAWIVTLSAIVIMGLVSCASAPIGHVDPDYCMYHLGGIIDAERADSVEVWALTQAPRCVAPVMTIDSTGGFVLPGLTIMRSISALPLTCVVTTRAESMALVVLQACKERIAMPGATLTIDRPRPMGPIDEALAESIIATITEVLSSRAAESAKGIIAEWMQNKDATTTVEPSMAVEIGLIDEVYAERIASDE